MREKAWKVLKKVILDKNGKINPKIYSSKGRGECVNRVVNGKSSLKMRVYRLLKRFLQRGQVKNAILPDYIDSGAPGRARENDKKQGRKHSHYIKTGQQVGVPLTKEVKEQFSRGIELFHKEGRLLKDTYINILEEYYATGYEIKDGVAIPIIPGEDQLDQYPTQRQFENFFYKAKHTDYDTYFKKILR